MRLDEEQMDDLFSLKRNGIISTKYHWPDRTIPYRLTHKHTKKQRNFIELALSKIASVSCLKFVRQTNEKNYIEITVSMTISRSNSIAKSTNWCVIVISHRLKTVDVIRRLDLRTKYKHWICNQAKLDEDVSNLEQ